MLGFAIALAFVTGLTFGVGPAHYASRIGSGLPGRTATAAPRRTRTGQALVATQIAVTIVLLTASLALGRAFLALLRVDNGFEVRTLATMSISFAGTAYANAERSQAYYAEVVRRVRDIPGVVAVSATESMPLNVDSFMGGRFTLDKAARPRRFQRSHSSRHRSSAPLAVRCWRGANFHQTISETPNRSRS